MTTCDGGQALDQVGPPKECDGHHDEFEKKHRTSGVAIFFAVVIPFAVAGAVGWWVWRNWNGKFGQIRLGEQGQSVFDSDRVWVKYPVIVVSAIVAVVVAMPVLLGSLWRAVSSRRGGGGGWGSARFTTRDSFARGRGDYAVVDEDEGELLGEDSDEEV